jgi:septal ring-binding cell division protein DamX
MASSIKRPSLITPRSPKAYRLEMEGRTIALMVGMMALTGVIVFTLGMVTGMGMRDPSGGLPVAALSTSVPGRSEPSPPAESLAFNKGVAAPQPTIEGLKLKESEASGQTSILLKRAERELKLEEIPVSRPKITSNTPAAKPAAQASNSPAAPVAKRSNELYTVQVFSSRHQDRARDLMLKLKRQGFAAYMNQYQGTDRASWFRVRVGKLNRADAQRMVDRLKSKAKLKAPRIIQL